jgi:hypothetical protein
MPMDIAAALNGMKYESATPNIIDTVNVTLYDGEGGRCLDNNQLGTGSIRKVRLICMYIHALMLFLG